VAYLGFFFCRNFATIGVIFLFSATLTSKAT
jgi:hypothetical protein